MRHCTICGAAAREGAKFCTSCGARLPMDETAEPRTTVPAEDTSTLTAAPAAPTGTPEASEPERASGGETDAGTSADDQLAEPVETVEPSARPVEYVASWPEPSDTDDTVAEPDEASESETVSAPAPESFATDADQDPAPSRDETSSWAWGQTSTEPRETASSGFATDADQEPGSARSTTSWSWSAFGKSAAEPDAAEAPERLATDAEERPGSVLESDADTTEAAEPDAQADVTTDDDADHHGASQWESWAPVAAGAATVPASGSEAVRSVRGLLHELANRIDRLVDPATIASREVDPDELADQLGKWSRSVPGTDGLLEAVQAVRKSPRDLDALVALADRAPDLELLVRHYQSITASSDRWATELRTPREGSTDNPTA